MQTNTEMWLEALDAMRPGLVVRARAALTDTMLVWVPFLGLCSLALVTVPLPMSVLIGIWAGAINLIWMSFLAIGPADAEHDVEPQFRALLVVGHLACVIAPIPLVSAFTTWGVGIGVLFVFLAPVTSFFLFMLLLGILLRLLPEPANE